jgi:hypothetical protein
MDTLIAFGPEKTIANCGNLSELTIREPLKNLETNH